MKSWIILVVLAVAFTAVATVAVPFLSPDSTVANPGIPAPSAIPDGPEPVVEVEGDLLHKFGLMAQEIQGKHGWMFKNAGPGILELKNLGTDCQCTVAQLGTPNPDAPESSAQPTVLQLKPGKAEPIELTWKTNKTDGAYRKSARIGTNDPKRPVITLTVEGTVRPSITVTDSAIDFRMVTNDEPVVRHVALFSGDRPETKITKITSQNPDLIGVESRPLTAEECTMLKTEKGFSLTITLKPGNNLGNFAEEIKVETDHPSKAEVILTARGKVTGPISMVPDKVVLRDVQANSGASQSLIIWARGQAKVAFQVVSKPQALDVVIAPISQAADAKGSKYMMTVKVNAGTPAGVILDEIVLKSDHPRATEIHVPVDILVQASN